MLRISRFAFLGLAGCALITVGVYPSFSQVQPLIVDLAATALRGLVWGAAGEAGKEIVQGSQNGSPSRPEALHTPQGGSTQNSSSNNFSSTQIVPIEPPPPPYGIRWQIRNEFGANIVMQFYAPERHVHWPAGDRAYLLVTGQTSVIRLRCVPGEKVCYGGNVPGHYWGVGLSIRHPCGSCCRTCGSSTSVALR